MVETANISRAAAWAFALILIGLSEFGHANQRVQATKIGNDMITYRIDEPNVRQAVTPFPSVTFAPGDQVTVSAGGCVQTGGLGKTWKRYVDPSGKDSDRFYHGRIQLPGDQMRRIQDLIGLTKTIPSNASPLTLRLGYEDDGYDDNGYTAHDDGTDDQCKGVGAAWVVLVVQHASAPSGLSFQPIPKTPGVNGLPILTTDYNNPSRDTSAQSFTDLCQNKKWLANASPRYEWTPVYSPTIESDDQAGLSGQVLFPQDVAENAGLSQHDVPFTHPFGFDWETFIAPDATFNTLLAPSNTGVSAGSDQAAGEYADAMKVAQARSLEVPSGVMGTETDRGLIPLPYRAKDGDRIALFGRWIVDCGHTDFHSEVHPPLLVVKAQAMPGGSNPDAPSSGAASMTYARIISRPYLVGQEFGDGALRSHLEKEVAKVLIGAGPVAASNRIEAHPKVYPAFSGLHVFSYVVRAPVLPPSTGTGAFLSSVLAVKFHFTVRTGVAVQVIQQGKDSVKVFVAMNAVNFKAPRLPVRHDFNVSFSDLKTEEPDTAAYINGALAVGGFTRGAFDLLIARGILTDRYDPPIAASVHDGEIISTTANALGGKQFSVDDDQPFPVYGWLSLEWKTRRVISVQPSPPVGPIQPSTPPSR